MALWQRTNKTVLVEGPSDKRLIDRLRLEHCIRTGVLSKCSVDQVEVVSDAALANLGNKARVLHVVGALPPLLPDVSDRMTYLVDREWEGVNLEPLPQTHTALPQSQWGFRTKGHSIENYALSRETLAQFYKMYFAASLPAEFFVQLAARFSEMLRLSLAVSLVARSEQISGRCEGLFRASDFNWSGVRYELLPSINAKLTARGCQVDLQGLSLMSLTRADVSSATEDVMRWLCHGHLATQVIRACAGSIARELGGGDGVVADVETGRKQDKINHDAHVMASWSAAEIEPLSQLVSWTE